jgi:hypothetical protein
MASLIPVYAPHSDEVIAHALVDAADHDSLAASRWVMQGAPDAPRYIQRYRSRRERAADEPHTIGLAQQLLGCQGRITFRNGNPLDFRRANLVRPQDRQRRHEQSALALADATHLPGDPSAEPFVELPLTHGWTACIDAAWEERVCSYHWRASLRGRAVYALRQIKLPSGRAKTIYLQRVIAGRQDVADGAEIAPGVVALKQPADWAHQRIDLRAANLMVTTRAGANLNQPMRARYRGVQRQGLKYRAYIQLDGHDRVLGLYDTPEEAARARDEEIIRLGLQHIARLNHAPIA